MDGLSSVVKSIWGPIMDIIPGVNTPDFVIDFMKRLCREIVCERGTDDEDLIKECEQYWDTSNITGNSSSTDFIDITSTSKIVLSVLYCITFIMALIGNTAVLVTFCYMRSFRVVTNVLIINLAISDLLVTLFCMPFNVVMIHTRWWDFGSISSFTCKMVPYMQSLSVIASIFTLTCIAAERYVAIILPLKARTMNTICRTVILVVYIWILAVLFSVPNALWYTLIDLKDIDIGPDELPFDVTSSGSNPQTQTDAPCPWDPDPDVEIASTYLCVLSSEDVERMKIYFYMFFGLLFLFPLVTMLFIYSEVSYRLWVRHTIGNQSVTYDQMRLKTSKRVVAMLMIVLSLFIVCWAPLQIFTLYVFITSPETTETNLNMKYYFQWLALSNSAYNPLVYTFLHEKFRKTVGRVGCCKSNKVHTGSTEQQPVRTAEQQGNHGNNSSNGTGNTEASPVPAKTPPSNTSPVPTKY